MNAAEGSGPGYVDTDQNFYRVFGIKYKGLKLQDAVHTNIAMYFNGAANYIDDALKQGGKITIFWTENVIRIPRNKKSLLVGSFK